MNEQKQLATVLLTTCTIVFGGFPERAAIGLLYGIPIALALLILATNSILPQIYSQKSQEG